MPSQDYLSPAPVGIDAPHAWQFEGGLGEEQVLADIERGWILDHEAIRDLPVVQLGGRNEPANGPHGTAVLGVLAARANPANYRGIAPCVGKIVLISRSVDGLPDHADQVTSAIHLAIRHLSPGSVLLLSVELGGYPVEVHPPAFEAIQRATERGIVVIEAAGDAGIDLDTDATSAGAMARRPDSGAILVSAIDPNYKTLAGNQSSKSSRVNCYAWGDGVKVLGGESGYEGALACTSSAAPIVAGAAVLVQGIHQASRGRPLDPAAMRGLLATQGTPSQHRIGVMPDLRAVLDALERQGPPLRRRA